MDCVILLRFLSLGLEGEETLRGRLHETRSELKPV